MESTVLSRARLKLVVKHAMILKTSAVFASENSVVSGTDQQRTAAFHVKHKTFMDARITLILNRFPRNNT